MSFLNEVIKDVLADLHRREALVPMDEIKERALRAPDALDALAKLKGRVGAVSIIAEIKRNMPPKDRLSPIPDAGALASLYEAGGASAVSVFTESHHFGGCLEDLDAVRKSVDLPIMRKDIIMTPYQIHESRAHGADLVLLLASVLEDPALVCFLDRVHSLGMHALVEVHSRLEALRALEAGAKIIGVNARDLHTFEVDRDKVEQVLDVIPPEVVAVAESGVRGPRDVFQYAKWGADAVLVGEALVTSADPLADVKDMVSAGSHPALLKDRKARVRRALEDL